jgi:hypothetical protein
MNIFYIFATQLSLKQDIQTLIIICGLLIRLIRIDEERIPEIDEYFYEMAVQTNLVDVLDKLLLEFENREIRKLISKLKSFFKQFNN